MFPAASREMRVPRRSLYLLGAGTTPGTIAAYYMGGHFSEGAVLIKEAHQTSTGPMATGTVSRAKTLKGWFVMVKDSKNNHPDNTLLGGRLGMVVVRCGRSHENDLDQLQNRLLPCPRQSDGLDLYERVSHPQVGDSTCESAACISTDSDVQPTVTGRTRLRPKSEKQETLNGEGPGG